MAVSSIIQQCSTQMKKSLSYFESEIRGVRSGRATTALVDFIKIDAYGSPTDIRDIATTSVPEPTQILVKPYDPSLSKEIIRALESSDLGLNPQEEGPSIRVIVPAPSAERREQLTVQIKKMTEEARVALQNERRESMKSIEQMTRSKDISEDEAKKAKSPAR